MVKKVKRKKTEAIKGYDIVKLRIRRFLAMVIDWYLVSMIASLPVTFYLRGDTYIQADAFKLSTYGTKTGVLLGVFVLVIGVIYYLVIPTIVWKGQTVGKKICKVKVIKETGEEVNSKTMFIREIVGATILEGGIVVTAAYIRQMISLLVVQDVFQILQYLAYGITILSIAYAYFQPLSQSFHDKLAKTIVIKN